MSSLIFRIAPLIVVLHLAVPVSAAETAADRARARSLLVEGGRLLQQGSYAQALNRFQSAYAVVPSPRIFYNFGQAYDGLDRPSESLLAFRRFLAEAKEAPAPNVARARALATELEGRVGMVAFRGDIDGAEISIDGRVVSSTDPGGTPVDPGTHQVTAHKPGFPPFVQKLELRAKQREVVEVRFTPVASITAASPAPATATSPEASVADSAPPAGRSWRRTAAWSATAVGATALAAGAGFAVVAAQRYGRFNDHRQAPLTVEMQCSRNAPQSGGGQCGKLLSAADSVRNTALVLAGTGVVAGTAAAILFLTGLEKTGTAVGSVVCVPTLLVSGAACRVSF